MSLISGKTHETRRYTVLITDLVDSTKLTTELGDARMVEVWVAHDRVARDLLEPHNGWEVDKSDGFLILFERPLDGIRYALAYHAGLKRLSAELGVKLSARAGLHAGEVSVLKVPDADVARGAKQWEVEGVAKPLAARIMSVALGGQTLLSDSTRDELPEDTGDVRLVSHGHYRMKGVAEPIEVFEAGRDDAPLRPPPDAPKVYRVVQTAEGWRPAREVPNNLPPARGGFFGRDPELRAIADIFDDGRRLVTLIGPGGTGKTSLSLRFGATWLGDWPGGVWFADLSEAHAEAAIARALAGALGVPIDQDDPVAVLGAALESRGRALVILDNFEQLVEHAPATVGRWLDLAPEAAWLVTSRQRLGLRGEQGLPIEPLPLPPVDATVADIDDNPAGRLFVDRARAVQPSFRLDEGTARAIASLVRLLDGLPLAIELAAARVRVLPPQKILQRMGRRFDLLRGGARGAPTRQGTLRGAIDWSWDLLEPHARAALAQCGVFEGSFDLEAAEAILDLSPWPDAPWPMDVVEALVEQSLIRALPAADGGTRFSLFQSILEYAREKLADPDAVPDATGPEPAVEAEARHGAWYARWGEPESIESLFSGREDRLQLESDQDNVVAAAWRAARAGQADVAALATLGAMAMLQVSGPLTLAADLARAALAAAPEPALTVRLQIGLGVVELRSGQLDLASDGLQRALEAARRLGDRRLEAEALSALGQARLLHGDLAEAEARFEAALDLHRASGNRRGEAAAHAELAHVLGIRGGQHDEAAPHIERALSLTMSLGDEAGEALCRSYEGALLAIRGDLDAGRAAYERARDLARALGDRRTQGLSEGMIAGIFALRGSEADARAHFEAALAIQSSIGDRIHEAMHAANYGDLLARQGEDAAAADMLDRAIRLARANQDAATEGIALGTLGAVQARAAHLEEAHATLALGEARLREAGNPGELAKLLCKMGSVELALSRPDAAAARLAEAKDIAAALELGAGTEIHDLIVALETSL